MFPFCYEAVPSKDHQRLYLKCVIFSFPKAIDTYVRYNMRTSCEEIDKS